MISRNAFVIAMMAGLASPALAQADAPPTAPVASQKPTAQPASTEEKIVITGRFVDPAAKSAMKMDVRVLDTPYSVSSYSGAFVKSLETQNVTDLYNYMTGLKKSGNTAYDITLRGFKSSGDDRNAIMVDGLPGLTGRYGSPPTIGVDHIELVKGPMSVLYGQIQPGGFVNLVTKKPQRTQSTTFEVRGNSFFSPVRGAFDHNGLAEAVDVTGPVTSNDKLLYRVVGQLTRNEGFRDYAYTHQQFIQPSLTFILGSDTQLTAQYEYRHTREHFDVGLAAPFDGLTSATSTIYDINAVAPITTQYDQPTDYRSETGKAASAYLTHQFGKSWKLSLGYRHVDYSSDQDDVSSNGVNVYAGQQRVTRRARKLLTFRTYDYADLNITGKVRTGGLEHKLLLGINGGSDSTEENRLKFFNGASRNTKTGLCPAGGICLDVALYNPDFSGFPSFDSLPATNPGQQNLLTDRKIKSHNYGIYASDLVTLTPWLKVSGSLRNFSETSETHPDLRNSPLVSSKKTTKRNFLPSVGILIEPTRHLTFYSSYAESFVPPDPGLIDINGQNNFQPITAKQYEFGVKADGLLDRRLDVTAALYRIDQNGQITQTICPLGSCSVQIGTARSDGLEVEGNFRPVQNWQLLFGYSHINAKVTSASPDQQFQVGRRLPNVAKNAANLWSRYDWKNGLGVGLGVTYTGQREGVLPTTANDLKPLNLPAYTVVDSGLYYQHGVLSLNLKIGNIFNKKYFESSGGGSQGRVQIQPGQPRYATLTARVSF